MRLAGVVLENFKSFAERTFVPMAPITLIFGENSGGKSSILQSLLLLKQSASHAEMGRPLILARGELVDLGSIREMLFAHDPDRTCEISPVLAGKELGYSDIFWPYRHMAVGIGVRFGCSDDSSVDQLTIRELPVYVGSSEAPLFTLSGAAPDRDFTDLQLRPAGPLNPLEEMYAPGNLFLEHPALPPLYKMFMDEWRDVDQVLSEWPEHDSIKTWEWYRGSDDGSDAEDPMTAQGYIASTIGKFMDQGRDLASELRDRFGNYSYEQFLADVSARKSPAFRLRGFFPSREGIWTRPVDEAASPPLPSLDEVMVELFQLRHDEDGLYEAKAGYILLPDLCEITSEAQKFSGRLIDRIAYVGPLRERPSRHYMHSGLVWLEVDKSGANLAEILLNDDKILADLNENLRVLGADYQVAAVPLNDPEASGLFWLRLTDTRTGVAVSPLDVGFGVGQVLPVVAQLCLSRGKVLLFEQPEIHLHPRLQAELGSLLVRSVGAPYHNQVIVETHSEYIVYRLQKEIRLGRIKPEDVSICYVTKDERGSHCLQLRLDEEGDFLDPWPGGFFDTGFDEIFGIR